MCFFSHFALFVSILFHVCLCTDACLVLMKAEESGIEPWKLSYSRL